MEGNWKVEAKYGWQFMAEKWEDTIAVIEDSPNKLLAVPSIGKKRVGMIRESWERQKEVKNSVLFFLAD